MKIEIALAVEVPDKTNSGELSEHVEAAERAVTHDGAGEPVEGVKVLSRSVKTLGTAYTVVGTTRGKPDDRIEVEVVAESKEEAERKAIAENDKLAVAAVLDQGRIVATPIEEVKK